MAKRTVWHLYLTDKTKRNTSRQAGVSFWRLGILKCAAEANSASAEVLPAAKRSYSAKARSLPWGAELAWHLKRIDKEELGSLSNLLGFPNFFV